MSKFKLGVTVRDKITGFSGIITGHAEYLTGCDQYAVQPDAKDNKWEDGKWFDEGRIELIGKGINKKDVLGDKNGADFSAPIK